MKLAAYLLLAVIIVSMVITPIVELLLAFSDMCRISAAVVSSSRAAILTSADDLYIRDADAAIRFYDSAINITDESEKGFLHKFVESLCICLDLDYTFANDYTDSGTSDYHYEFHPNKANRYNKFSITITPISEFDDGFGNLYEKHDGANNLIYNKCLIEIDTPYKFKTPQMIKLVEELPSSAPTLKVRWTQTLEHIPTAPVNP